MAKEVFSDTRRRLADVFCGAGGMTLGFSERFGNPFVPIWANDVDACAVATYNENFGEHCVQGSIVDILSEKKNRIPRADVVIGGPPCQGFSLLNKNRMDDNRRQLWKPFLEVVDRSDAEVFVMENVPQLLFSDEFKAFVTRARTLGFGTKGAVLCAADYGVPQIRYRAIILGCRFADPGDVFPPKQTHRDPNADPKLPFNGEHQCAPWVTVRDAIGDLPEPVGIEPREADPPLDWHIGRLFTALSLERYRSIPNEGMNRYDLQRIAPHLTPPCWLRKTSGGTDLFGRLWWAKPAHTIRTEFHKPEKGRFLHPEQHRPLTHREAARLQSFPDDFRFIGSKIAVARQIGNAVPPSLASKIAESVELLFARCR